MIFLMRIFFGGIFFLTAIFSINAASRDPISPILGEKLSFDDVLPVDTMQKNLCAEDLSEQVAFKSKGGDRGAMYFSKKKNSSLQELEQQFIFRSFQRSAIITPPRTERIPERIISPLIKKARLFSLSRIFFADISHECTIFADRMAAVCQKIKNFDELILTRDTLDDGIDSDSEVAAELQVSFEDAVVEIESDEFDFAENSPNKCRHDCVTLLIEIALIIDDLNIFCRAQDSLTRVAEGGIEAKEKEDFDALTESVGYIISQLSEATKHIGYVNGISSDNEMLSELAQACGIFKSLASYIDNLTGLIKFDAISAGLVNSTALNEPIKKEKYMHRCPAVIGTTTPFSALEDYSFL